MPLQNKIVRHCLKYFLKSIFAGFFSIFLSGCAGVLLHEFYEPRSVDHLNIGSIRYLPGFSYWARRYTWKEKCLLNQQTIYSNFGWQHDNDWGCDLYLQINDSGKFARQKTIHLPGDSAIVKVLFYKWKVRNEESLCCTPRGEISLLKWDKHKIRIRENLLMMRNDNVVAYYRMTPTFREVISDLQSFNPPDCAK